MTKIKSTKRALLLSALALLMCVSMLMGTTFAWFTDSVTSAGNVIQSGNLKVDLVDEAGESLKGKIIEFVAKDGRAQDEILWEPGCTYQTEPVFVENKGNLALKYVIAINGIDGDAKLLEAIEWTVTIDGVETDLSSFVGHLTSGEKSKAIVLSGHMKEEAGNEYQGLTAEGISFTVFATQDTVEFDSFDDQYDDIALVSNADELKAAIAEGKNVMLTADVAVDANNIITVADDANIILDLNGHEINGTSSAIGKNRTIFTVKGEMSVIGNGTVSYVHTGDNMGWNNLTTAFSVEGGTLTLGEGVNVVNNGGSDMAYGVDVNTTLGAATLNVNGAIIYSTYTGVRIFNNHKTAKGTVNFNEGFISGDSRDIWAHNPSANAVDANAVVNIADVYNYDMTVQTATYDSRIYSLTDYDVVADVDDLAAALAAGKNVVLATDVKVENDTLAVNAGQDIVIDLNGNTLTAVNTEAKASAAINNKGTLTLKNGTVTYEGVGDPNFGYGTNTINNTGKLVIDGATIINTTDAGSSVAIDCSAGAELIVNSGVIKSVKNAIRLCPFANGAINCTVNGGEITGARAIQIQLPSNKPADAPEINLTVNGGTLSALDTVNEFAVYSYSAGQSFANVNVTIAGGTFNGYVAFGGGNAADNENVTITGGTFNNGVWRLDGGNWVNILP